MIDINHPKIRWAQQLADKNKVPYCLVENQFGDYDIKKTSEVSPYVNNPRIATEIHPSAIAQKVKPIFKYSAVSV